MTRTDPMSVCYGLLSAQVRRDMLCDWLNERPEHNGLTATEIVDVSGLYAGHYRYSRCFDDLMWNAEHGNVIRHNTRAARWTARKYADAP